MVSDNAYKPLYREFYERDTAEVAKDLLGKYLVRIYKRKHLIGKIVETEAYLPFNDPASHAYKGLNRRNKSQFSHPGHTYVHSSRHHFLLDVVTEKKGVPGSVLIRALEPVSGLKEMKQNRNTDKLLLLTSGPARICKALSITLKDDGLDLSSENSRLYISESETTIRYEVKATKRVGISKAVELPLRFYIKGSLFVSRPS